MDHLVKILFLDIDGVLVTEADFDTMTEEQFQSDMKFDQRAIEQLYRIIKETNCKIVLSSSWRHSNNWRQELKQRGLEPTKIIDITPDLQKRLTIDYTHYKRGSEIKNWLERHPDISSYAILDDDNDFFPNQPLFQTNSEDGLTPEIAEAIIKHLNSNQEKTNY